MTGDSWYGSIPGYDEVREFQQKLAKQLEWLPGSIGMGNPQMSQASAEFRKNAIKMDGMPLVMFTSFGMAANGQAGQSAASQQNAQTSQQQSASDNTPTNPKDAIAKSLGGFFKKKKQESDSNASTTSSSGVPQPAPVAGSMMDVTTEVTAYSKDSLDASLFDIPAGYTQMQPPQADATAK